MFHYLIFCWYILSTTSANNFSDISPDVLLHTMEYLPQQDQLKFRINKRCSSCYNTLNQQILNNIKELNHTIQNLQSIELNDTIKQQIQTIYNESRTHELYIVNLPYFVIKLHQFASSANEDDADKFEIMSNLLGLNYLKVSNYSKVDWITSFLIRAGKYITEGIDFNPINIDINTLWYKHCFEYANKINDSKLPLTMEAIYDQTLGISQEQMDYIYYLMDEYGFVAWHRNFIERKWEPNNLNLKYYFQQFQNLLDFYNRNHVHMGDHYDPFSNEFALKFFRKLTENCNINLMTQNISASGMIQDIIDNFFDKSAEQMEDFEMFLWLLKRNNGLMLLNENKWLQQRFGKFGINNEITRKMFEKLCSVIINDEIHLNMSDEFRIRNQNQVHIIARCLDMSFYATPKLTIIKHLFKLCEPDVFDIHILNKLVRIYNTFEFMDKQVQRAQLQDWLLVLCQKRGGWDFTVKSLLFPMKFF